MGTTKESECVAAAEEDTLQEYQHPPTRGESSCRGRIRPSAQMLPSILLSLRFCLRSISLYRTKLKYELSMGFPISFVFTFVFKESMSSWPLRLELQAAASSLKIIPANVEGSCHVLFKLSPEYPVCRYVKQRARYRLLYPTSSLKVFLGRAVARTYSRKSGPSNVPVQRFGCHEEKSGQSTWTCFIPRTRQPRISVRDVMARSKLPK